MTEPTDQADSSQYSVLQSSRPLPLAEISSLLREFYSGVLSFGEDRDSAAVSDDLTPSANMPYGHAHGQLNAPVTPAAGRAMQIQKRNMTLPYCQLLNKY